MPTAITAALPAAFSRTVAPPGNLPALRCAWGRLDGAAMLESLPHGAAAGRLSLFAADPVRTIRVSAQSGVNPFEVLACACRPWSDVPRVEGGAWPGPAWIGHLSYEAGRFVEPGADWRHFASAGDIARWSLYDTFLVHDARTDGWSITAFDLPAAWARAGRPCAEQRAEALEAWLAAAAREGKSGARPHSRASISAGGAWDDAAADYLACCRRALAYIREGDVFQVNLARRYSGPLPDHPADLYARLCHANPADYATYLSPRGDAPAIVSSSPELFLHLAGGEVVTRPIKGTRPRTGHAGADAAARRELAASPKDRAELTMIIDLERNDLSRVCDFGSVRVISDGDIETLPHVFHRTATVAGRLRGGADAIDLLRATFPGGSITGAPKVRAMQIIHELESAARGAYCGAIGFITLDGDMMLNLAIRTMSAHVDSAGFDGAGADARCGTFHFHVGSGIVADSTPEEELAELDAKAVGLLAAVDSPVVAPVDPPMREPIDIVESPRQVATGNDRVMTGPARTAAASGAALHA